MFRTATTFLSPPLSLPLRRGATPKAAATSLAESRSRSLYEVLRVHRKATPSEIKTAYRSLAKAYHPDTCRGRGDDENCFVDINYAYETLSDPISRSLYDLSIGLLPRCVPAYSMSRRWETDQCW